MEHYSNFDCGFPLPAEEIDAMAMPPAIDRVSIAATRGSSSMKRICCPRLRRAYTRIVIYPSRSLQIIKEKFKAQRAVSEMSAVSRSTMPR